MVVQKEHLYTIAEFEEFSRQPANHERLLELIYGRIVEKLPTQEHGELQALIGSAVLTFVRPRKLGRVGVEISHQMPADNANSRLPDVSFIAGNRPRVTEGSVPQMPDLAVEIKSPDDSLKALRDKADYYMLHGTRMVWIVNPAKRLVIVLTPDDEDILVEGDTLTGGDVLPGFELAVRDIFADHLAGE